MYGYSYYFGDMKQMIYVPETEDIYLAGSSGKFAKYTAATDTAVDLSGAASFIAGREILAAGYDKTSASIYLAGYSNGSVPPMFGRYNIASGTATDLSSRFGSIFGPNSGVGNLVVDVGGRAVYLMGWPTQGMVFLRYNIVSDTVDNLSGYFSAWGTGSTSEYDAMTFSPGTKEVFWFFASAQITHL